MNEEQFFALFGTHLPRLAFWATLAGLTYLWIPFCAQIALSLGEF